MENNSTVYFSGFSEEYNKEFFEEFFAAYGVVNSLFLNKLKKYGMVEFENSEIANEIIQKLNKKPPLFLYLNFAQRKNPQDLNASSMQGNNHERIRYPNLGNAYYWNRSGRRSTPSHTPSLTDSLPEDDDIILIKEKIYLDENNELVDILTEPSTGEVYVPIRYAKSIRILVKTVPKYKKNLLAEGYALEDIANLGTVKDDTGDCSFSNNSHSGRRVIANPNLNEGFKINIQNEVNSSFSGDNGVACNQPPRRPHYNKFYKPNYVPNHNRFSDSPDNHRSDNFKENKPFNREEFASNAPNKQVTSLEIAPAKQEAKSYTPNKRFNKSEIAPSDTQEATSFIPNKQFNRDEFASNAPNKQFSKSEITSPAKLEAKSYTPNKRFNKSEVAPSDSQEATSFKPFIRKTPRYAKQQTIVKSPPPIIVNSVPVTTAKLINYTTVELPVNEFTAVNVEAVVSDTVGWVRMVAHDEVVDDMARIIMKEMETEPAKCELQVGKLVLAKYETILLRAVILAITPEIRVRYIDYGEEAKLAAEDIQGIADRFTTIPAYSFCVKLAEQAPFKMQNGLTMNIKPVKKEDDVTVVHVENGIYEKEGSVVQPEKQVLDTKHVLDEKHTLDILHDILISKLEVKSTGYIELTLKLTPTQHLGIFMPMEITDYLIELQTIVPKADPSFKPKIGDIVCAKNAEGWQRAYLLSVNEGKLKYTVAFIDYATVDKVEEISPLPEDFLKYPIFSCVCFLDSGKEDTISKLNGPVDFVIKSIENKIIRCNLEVENVSICEINVKPWDPRVEIPNSYKNRSVGKHNLGPVEELVVNDGADVKLILEKEGKLYLRTKQSSVVLKKVNEYMMANGANGPTLQEAPQVGQWVAAKYENDWFRATVLAVNGKQATVWFLDYGDDSSESYFTLRKLDPEMIQQPASLIKIQLKNFKNVTFDQKCLAYLAKLDDECLKAIKYGNTFELVTRSGIHVSEALMQMAVKAPPVMASPANAPFVGQKTRVIQVPGDHESKYFGKSLLSHELTLGRTQILLQELKDPSTGLICVCTNQPDILHRIQVELLREITHYATNIASTEAYDPEMDECVLVENEGKWYRGVCASEGDEIYTVFLMDYACAVFVPGNKLKRIPKEFAEEKALTTFAVVHGLPDNPSEAAVKRLESLLQKNECYSVDVVQKNEDDCYTISFPEISQILKDEKLLN